VKREFQEGNKPGCDTKQKCTAVARGMGVCRPGTRGGLASLGESRPKDINYGDKGGGRGKEDDAYLFVVKTPIKD